jgi:hypothetical protein
LRSMITSTGQLDLDERGHWDFHGGSSGTVFVRRMREQFDGLLGGDYSGPLLPRIPRLSFVGSKYGSPSSAADSPVDAGPNAMDLPSRDVARAYCRSSLDNACCLLRFVHQPTFWERFDRIYDTPAEEFGDEEHRFLPLLHAVLALGCMFREEVVDDPSGSQSSYKTSIDYG